MSSKSGWTIVIIWLYFGTSQVNTCGKFQFEDNTRRCRPCRKCRKNIDEVIKLGLHVDKCIDTANPTPEWLDGIYYCQGIHDSWPECKEWNPQNGHLSCSNGMRIDTNCRLHCIKDYYPSLNESVTCTGDLEWNKPVPYCVHINDSITTTPKPECPVWSPSHGYINCTNSRDVGSVCTLSCNEGFDPSHNQGITCSKQLQWDGQLPLCVPEPTTTTPRPTCQPLEVLNGTLYCLEDSFSGSECTVICNEGFTLSVNTTVICTDNLIWSDVPPSCDEIQKSPTPIPRCNDIAVENGTVSCTMDFDVGSYCNVTCSKGFNATSYEPLCCRPNQTWSNPLPLCVSSVPVYPITSRPTQDSFIWFIVCAVFGAALVVIVVLALCSLYRNRKNNNIWQIRRSSDSDQIELSESLRFPEDSDCESCGKYCVCLMPKTTSKVSDAEQGQGNHKFVSWSDYHIGGSLDQPIDKPGGSSDEPINHAGGSSDEPINHAAGSSDEPINHAGGSSNEPINHAGGSSDEPINRARGPSNEPINHAGGSSDEPISRAGSSSDTGRNFQISEELASAEALKSISYEDMMELTKLFDRSSLPDKFNWKMLASIVLKLNCHEIEHIEYKHKENETGPTQKIFRRMGTEGKTLFKVINVLESYDTHSNVKEALKILYKYCDDQIVI
ncbi:hypothetical protein LOTGIDRAFT_236700 [Lottia gigantea]|uniref:Sushi domain-containing protein n=1 Tax=Lottia gigantea TaxID=225164 RepID=V4B4N7_LOTGI|nr:hypothetical protein LOTGIDRAFT_236700 [Lottia gigantea]ESO83384.1 hypothetical protein LOTGIDRAFT_236700 [Lottia gigantea]